MQTILFERKAQQIKRFAAKSALDMKQYSHDQLRKFEATHLPLFSPLKTIKETTTSQESSTCRSASLHISTLSIVYTEEKLGFTLKTCSGLGVVVGRVLSNSHSDSSGVQAGAIITAINGEPVPFCALHTDVVKKLKMSSRPVSVCFQQFHTPCTLLPRNEAKSIVVLSSISCDTAEEVMCVSILKEIFATECLFVRDLHSIVKHYIGPLTMAKRYGTCRENELGSRFCQHNLVRTFCGKESKEILLPLLHADDISKIFGNLENLLVVNSRLLGELQDKLVASNEDLTLQQVVAIFGHTFCDVMPFFKVYAMYCHHYQQALQALAVFQKQTPEVHDFLKECEKQSQCNSLPSLLITPVQRICKYPLLFDSLLLEFSQTQVEEDADTTMNTLQQAVKIVEEIASFVNKHLGELEAIEKLVGIFDELGGSKFVPDLVQAHRKFVTMEEDEEMSQILYLFNDVLIVAKPVDFEANMVDKFLHRLSNVSQGSQGTRSSSLGRSTLYRAIQGSSHSSPFSLADPNKKQQVAKLKEWIEIRGLQPTVVEEEDMSSGATRFGINILMKQQGKKRFKLNATPTDHQQVWFREKEKRDSFFALLLKQVKELHIQDKGHSKQDLLFV